MNPVRIVETAFDRLTASARTRSWIYPAALLTLTAAGLLPLLYPGIPGGHDINFHLARICGVADGLRNGQFPVYINHAALNGFGYGTGLFYPDILLYPAAGLIALGMSTVAAYKLFLFFWCLFSAGSMFWAAKRISGSPETGFMAGLLYAWSSYFAVDVFSRAALGEVLAFPFLPMTLVGVWELLYNDSRKYMPMTIGFAGLFLSHNITTVLAVIMFGLWFALCAGRLLREPVRIFRTAQAGLLSILLAAFYFLPMIEQLCNGKFHLTASTLHKSIAERVVPITRLFLELPYMKLEYWIPSGIGVIFLIVLIQRFRFAARPGNREAFRDAALTGGVCALLAATSVLPWEGMFHALAGIQFPWRFYLPATAFLALGGALTLERIIDGSQARRRRWFLVLFCFCGFAWSFNTAYVYAAKIKEHRIIRDYKAEGKTVASGMHYLPVTLDVVELLDRDSGAVGAPSGVVCEVVRDRADGLSLKFSGNHADSAIELPLVYYTGFRAELENGAALRIGPSKTGLAEVVVPSGSPDGMVSVFYAGTRIQKVSGLVSLAAVLLMAAMALFGGGRRGLRAAKRRAC